MFELYRLQPEQDIPIYRQLVDMIQAQVKNGALAADTRLPTVRALADQLHVAPGTVKRAYDELALRGVICKAQGRGTFVCYQPANADSRKERAMAAIDRMLDDMEALDFSEEETRIFLDLKLRERVARHNKLKIALVECNPEVLSQLADQLHRTEKPVDLYPYLLSDVEQYPYRIAEDMDLVVTTAKHADALEGMISQKEKLAKFAMYLTPQSAAGLLRLTAADRVGILCRSRRFGALIHAACATYAPGAEICSPVLFEELTDAEVFLSGLSAVAIPDGFEAYCPRDALEQLRAFEQKRTLIHCRYQMDDGSLLYLNERIEGLRERKSV